MWKWRHSRIKSNLQNPKYSKSSAPKMGLINLVFQDFINVLSAFLNKANNCSYFLRPGLWGWYQWLCTNIIACVRLVARKHPLYETVYVKSNVIACFTHFTIQTFLGDEEMELYQIHQISSFFLTVDQFNKIDFMWKR